MMCAIQAQDYPMAKWAIGNRLPGSTDKDIEEAVNQGEILRTHLLRPTWHFVVPKDIYWLLELSAPQIKASQRARDKQLELTEAVYTKSDHIIEKELSKRGQLSREDLIVELNKGGIATDQNRASHLFMRAELDQIICSGTTLRGKPMYALLAERVPNPIKFSKEEALAELARRYYTSRSPATLQDFIWWSGLSAKDARMATELVSSEFDPERIELETYWLAHDMQSRRPRKPLVHLLPTYDEYIVSYTERKAAIAPELEQYMKEISDRGVFWPIITVNGQVIGTWKRTIQKDTVIIDTRLFNPISADASSLLEQSIAGYASFLGKKLVINH